MARRLLLIDAADEAEIGAELRINLVVRQVVTRCRPSFLRLKSSIDPVERVPHRCGGRGFMAVNRARWFVPTRNTPSTPPTRL